MPQHTAPALSPDVAWDRAVRARTALNEVQVFIEAHHTVATDRTTQDCRETSCCWDGCEVEYCTSCGELDVGALGCLHRELLHWLTAGEGVLARSLPGSDQERVALARESGLAHYAAFIERSHTTETAGQDGRTVLYCGGCQETWATRGYACSHRELIRRLCTSVEVEPAFMLAGSAVAAGLGARRGEA